MKKEELIEALRHAKINLPDLDIDKLSLYAQKLKEWNERMNLTSIVEEDDVFLKHFYDSLLPCALTDFNNKSIADIGSGAGFPGMVMALAYPSAKVTLIDATKKKFLFLEEIKESLGLDNVFFHVGRVEDMKEERESFDIVTSRGFASMNVFLEVASPLVKVHGEVIAMKGKNGKEEMKEAIDALEILGLRYGKRIETIMPNSGDVRMNFLFNKYKNTPVKYPREWAKIIKHPL